jgi:hypothetical protein
VTAFSTLPTTTQNAGILTVDIRDPRTGVTYPAGTPIPMTAFARKVLGGLPAPNVAGAANNYSIAQLFTNDDRQGGRQGRHADQPALSLFGRLRLAQSEHRRSAADSAAVGRRRQRQHLTRNKQLVLGTTYIATENRCSKSASAGRTRRAARTRRRSARPTTSASPACRPTRASPAACRRRHQRLLGVRPPGDEPAVAVPDRSGIPR